MSDPERAQDLIERYWDGLLELDPLLGTVSGEERFDDRLPDPSEAGRARAATLHGSALNEIATFDRGGLDETTRTSLDVLEAIARRFSAAIDHRTDRLAVASHL